MVDTSGRALTQLGWKPFFSEQVAAEDSLRAQPVRVMSVHRGRVTVLGEEYEGSIPSMFPARPDRRIAQPSATGC
jgi:ribosome biogenesis GTPase